MVVTTFIIITSILVIIIIIIIAIFFNDFTIANEALPIFLDKLLPAWLSIVLSVTVLFIKTIFTILSILLLRKHNLKLSDGSIIW